ncbi:zinc ABC transporter substrate-binding protein ZnuA [Parendozoicomonas haliclonae]|uniref:zinc ABC transporter substrate-binding protein ZnuA n=1 Tax=Parendozoicomonas haliclonae TaxID=1960125 RepID=UPI0013FDE8DF|nr:zinc ABC transporter substrate-binding protein ZnuA [Parendozoicomonas haliclonae]
MTGQITKAAALSLILLPAWASASSSPAKVLVSIKPLELIASAITDGVSQPELLLPPGTSPHDYSLRPSDVRKLTNADLVFWVGEDLESFMTDLLDRHVDKNRSIPLMDVPGVEVKNLLTAEQDEDEHAGHNHANEHGHEHDHHGHNHGSHDPHIWLSPENAIAMARTMTQALSEADKANAEKYQHNYLAFADKVQATDQLNQSVLKDAKKQGFFVFHDAWGYFTRHYGLTVLDTFTVSPEQAPGARHMVQLRNQLLEAGNTCIFREPQFKPSYLKTMTDKTDASVDVLDPLASDIKPGPDAYPQFMSELAVTIRDCLADAGQKPAK